MKTYLSPKEFSLIIEASESSIKRWVDKGEINAEVTDGGHRKIAVEEAIKFIRQTGQQVLRADLLGFPDVNSIQNIQEPFDIHSNQFFQFLIDGEAEKARGYLLKLYLHGYSIADICDAVVVASMSQIGELWQKDEVGICLEHHATDICIQAMNTLRMIFYPTDNAPIALGGAPQGDPYFIPSLCISAVLMSEGYLTVNLGPNTPIRSFQRAIDQYNPSIVWLSFSSNEHPRSLKNELELFIENLSLKNVQIVVGGRKRNRFQFLQDKDVFFGTTMTELAAFVKGSKLFDSFN